MTDPTPPATLDVLHRDLRQMAAQTTGRRRLVYSALAWRVRRIEQAHAQRQRAQVTRLRVLLGRVRSGRDVQGEAVMTAQEAADERGVSRTSVRNAIDDGRLTAEKVGGAWLIADDDAYRRWLREPIGPPQSRRRRS